MITTSALFIKVGRAVDVAGIDAVVAKLDEIEMSHPSSYYKSLEHFIIKETCLYYGVPVEAIKERKVNGLVAIARDMCFVLLSKHLNGLTNREIGNILGKSDDMVSMANRKFNDMSTKIKHEREFLEVYTTINERIRNFKRQLDI